MGLTDTTKRIKELEERNKALEVNQAMVDTLVNNK